MALDWGQPIPCGGSSGEECDQRAVVSLRYEGTAGHTHNCKSHEAYNREFFAVIGSAPIDENTCLLTCTIEPIGTAVPPSIKTNSPNTP